MFVDVSEPKYSVKIVKNALVPMRDGTKLAADLYLPDAQGKFPVVVEYSVYRKDDRASGRRNYHYFAQRGIAAARVDIRGTGGSEGFITDEYTQIETQDSYDTIEWLAKQDWCTGKVGMTGLSYSAYTTLSAAMLQPPSLKAIVPIMGADDRYSDGDQYRGGAKQGILSSASYSIRMVALNALPPYPEYAGKEWASIWQERLEKNIPWLSEWLVRQVDDEYWQECLGRRWHQVKCPAFIIGGWVDPFVTASTRLYAELKVPKKLLMGPWSHGSPDRSIPGPQIDHLREMMRWFAYWLRGDNTGIMEEPPVTIYIQQYGKPDRVREMTRGFWRNEDAWPPTRFEEKTLYLGEGTLLVSPPEKQDAQDRYEYNPLVGLCGGPWYGGRPLVMSTDQREDDALSVCYDTDILDSEVEIVGCPKTVLHVSSTADVAFFVVRLEDIAPDGVSTLVTKGLLNGTRRRGQSYADPMEPGEIYELDIQLDATAWVFELGHKIRLAVCSSDWPYIWPSPKEALNTIYRNAKHSSRLVLPVLPEQNPKLPEPHFHPPALVSIPQRTVMSSLNSEWRVFRDVYKKTAGIEFLNESKTWPSEGLSTLTHTSKAIASASAVDPGDVFVNASVKYVLEKSDMVIEATSLGITKSTKDAFHLTVALDVKLNGVPYFNRSWAKSVPRNLL